MAGEGLLLTSRELAYLLISNLFKMETTILSASIRVNSENGSRTVVMNTVDEFDFIDSQNGFAHGKRNLLKMSMSQLLHFINEADDDLGDDIAFMMLANDPTNQQIEDLLMGAKVNVEQTERTAGEQYESNGQQIIATYDSIHVSQFAINEVSAVGRFAIDYDGDVAAYSTSKGRRVAWNATRKSLRG